MTAAVNVEKILIVVDGRRNDADLFISSAVLAKVLATQKDVKVDLFFGSTPIAKSLWNLLVPRAINLLEKIKTPDYTLAIDRGDAIIDEVRWEQAAGKVNVMLYTKGGSIDPTTIAYDPSKPKYDQIIGIGFTNIEQMKVVLGDKAEILNAGKTHILHFVDLPNTGVNYPHSYPQQQIYAGVVVNHLRKLGLNLDPETAGELLLALGWATDQFSNFRTFSTTFVLWSELVRSGADPQKFSKEMKVSAAEIIQIQQQLIARQQKVSPQLIVSEIDSGEAAPKYLWHLDINPLRRFADVAIAIFKGEAKTWAVVSSQGENGLVNKLSKLPRYSETAKATILSHHCVIELSGDAAEVAAQTKALIDIFRSESKPADDSTPVNVKPDVPLAFTVERMDMQMAAEKPAAKTPEVKAPAAVNQKSAKPEVAKSEDAKVVPTKTEDEQKSDATGSEIANETELEPIPEVLDAEYEPLAPAKEKYLLEEENADEPVTGNLGGGFGGFGGGMGGLGGASSTSDPLPAAKPTSA